MNSNQIKGARNRINGKTLEQIIETACGWYSDQGIAEIEKTPEPMRILSSMKNGKFLCVFEKKAQPDFKGTLKGGRAVVFEAKCTTTDKLQQSVITPEQRERLDYHAGLGALCFVVISFDFKKYYRIPWYVFRDLKGRYGRKYIGIDDDISQYEIFYKNGILEFLK